MFNEIGGLWGIAVIAGPVIIGLALAYGIFHSTRRKRAGASPYEPLSTSSVNRPPRRPLRPRAAAQALSAQ